MRFHLKSSNIPVALLALALPQASADLYFSCGEGSSGGAVAENDRELCRWDGSTLSRYSFGASGQPGSTPTALVFHKNRLHFGCGSLGNLQPEGTGSGTTVANGYELCSFDGASSLQPTSEFRAAPHLVGRLPTRGVQVNQFASGGEPDSVPRFPLGFSADGDELLFFQCQGDILGGDPRGQEMCAWDGASTTTIVSQYDYAPGSAESSTPEYLASCCGGALMAWRCDATAPGLDVGNDVSGFDGVADSSLSVAGSTLCSSFDPRLSISVFTGSNFLDPKYIIGTSTVLFDWHLSTGFYWIDDTNDRVMSWNGQAGSPPAVVWTSTLGKLSNLYYHSSPNLLYMNCDIDSGGTDNEICIYDVGASSASSRDLSAAGSSDPASFSEYGGNIYFTCGDGANGLDLDGDSTDETLMVGPAFTAPTRQICFCTGQCRDGTIDIILANNGNPFDVGDGPADLVSCSLFCACSPCQNGGECQYLSESCDCAPGYTGDSCEINIDDCAANPCSVDLSAAASTSPPYLALACIDGVNSYTCQCLDGRSGTNCEIDLVDECASNPCGVAFSVPMGVCEQTVTWYTWSCTCNPGTVPLSSSCPTGCGFTTCDPGFDECDTCQDFNECNLDENKCRVETSASVFVTSGTCAPIGLTSTQCTCFPGTDGVNCENDLVDECQVNPCQGGGTCSTDAKVAAEDFTGFDCACRDGKSGAQCQTDDVIECSAAPCQNGATCISNVPADYVGFTCACLPGTSGTLCETDDVNECDSTPCDNGGTCDTSSRIAAMDFTSFDCMCPAINSGPSCSLDACDSGPCQNGATCEAVAVESYMCMCAAGTGGVDCETDLVVECDASPCLNGGTCSDNTANNDFTGVLCDCPSPWGGPLCQTDGVLCESSPCLNGATCVNVGPTEYQCTCPDGLSGSLCQTDFDECSSSPCENGGTCSAGADFLSYVCSCPEGVSGPMCETDPDECDSNPCQNGGTCVSPLPPDYTHYRCECPAGTEGVDCETDSEECASEPCQNGGTCTSNGLNSYECSCIPGVSGSMCEIDTDNECDSDPCANGGTCSSSDSVAAGDFVSSACTCTEAWEGPHCESLTPPSQLMPCHNGATCSEPYADRFFCSCRTGTSGDRCEIDDADECASDPCLNAATCTTDSNAAALDFTGYSCACKMGTSGDRCQFDDTDECGSSPCQNLGTCVQAQGSYTDFECQCRAGVSGIFCENDINECLSNPCQNGATCQPRISSGDFLGFECLCKPGVIGNFCEIDAINECAANPCQNGGQCSLLTNQGIFNEFKCRCPATTFGDRCENQVTACAPESPCLNSGTCTVTETGFTCGCLPGTTGATCETDLVDECAGTPCLNGGTCLLNSMANEPNFETFTCTCASGFTGATCTDDPCTGVTCQTGTTCVVVGSSPSCQELPDAARSVQTFTTTSGPVWTFTISPTMRLQLENGNFDRVQATTVNNIQGSFVVDSPGVETVKMIVLQPALLTASIGNVNVLTGIPTKSQTTVTFDIVVTSNSIPFSGDPNSPIAKQRHLQVPANGFVLQITGLGTGRDSDDITDTDSAIVWFLYIGVPAVGLCCVICILAIVALLIFAFWRKSKGVNEHHVMRSPGPVSTREPAGESFEEFKVLSPIPSHVEMQDIYVEYVVPPPAAATCAGHVPADAGAYGATPVLISPQMPPNVVLSPNAHQTVTANAPPMYYTQSY
eukprot:gene3316-630_t